jgi:hypothetical protein
MPISLAAIPLVLAAAVQLADPPITVTAHRWAPFISPMGEPFRARGRSDDTLALWFVNADRNRDGALTAAEMQADADRFFGRLDRDGNGEIEPEELVAYEWEMAPEVQVNSRWRQTASQATAAKTQTSAGGREPRKPRRDDPLPGFNDALQGASRYALLNIPQPVATADADFNRGITTAEFRAAAAHRFRLLDRANAGRIDFAQLSALVPAGPVKRQRTTRGKKRPDERLGTPLPAGN